MFARFGFFPCPGLMPLERRQSCTFQPSPLVHPPSACTGEPSACSRGCGCCDCPKEPEAHPIPPLCHGDSETWEAVRLEREFLLTR